MTTSGPGVNNKRSDLLVICDFGEVSLPNRSHSLQNLTYKSTRLCLAADMEVVCMRGSEAARSGWDVEMERMGDAELMAAELSHRVRNEVAAAAAALQLALVRDAEEGREHMIRLALRRLEGFGQVLDSLTVPAESAVAVQPALEAMCRGVWDGRIGLDDAMLVVTASQMLVDAHTAQRVMMVGYELLHNAIRHAAEGSRGMVAVILRGDSRTLRLSVIDDGPGTELPSVRAGSGMGTTIVQELVRRAGGRIERPKGKSGTEIVVSIPAKRLQVAAEA